MKSRISSRESAWPSRFFRISRGMSIPPQPTAPYNRSPTDFLWLSQPEAGNLRRARDADGQEHFANAAIHVNLSAVETVPAVDETHPQLRAPIHGTHDREPHLTAVRMTREHQVDSV